jgi:hypothetical protein
MDQGRKRRWLRPPSPSMIVALVALFVALGGTSYAATRLPANSVGAKELKKNAVTGIKVKNASLTGADLKVSTLGKVPSAARADSAASATHAVSADNATYATQAGMLGNVGPGVFGTDVRFHGVAFTPTDSDTVYAHVGGWGIMWSSGGEFFTLDLHLPQGAAITGYKIFFNNSNDGLGAGSVYLYRSDNANNGQVYPQAHSATSSGYGSATYSLPTPIQIDNAAYAYSLFWLASSSTANAFMGAEVDYALQ